MPSPPAFLSENGCETVVDICDQSEGTCGLRAAPFGWHCLSFNWAEEWLLPFTQLKIIQYGIVLHRKYFRPVQPFGNFDDFQYAYLDLSES